jgi:hypothetical protein
VSRWRYTATIETPAMKDDLWITSPDAATSLCNYSQMIDLFESARRDADAAHQPLALPAQPIWVSSRTVPGRSPVVTTRPLTQAHYVVYNL